MTIDFENPKHEELANDYEKLSKWCSKKTTATADEVLVTLDALKAAPTLFDVPARPFRPHPLKAQYKGCFAVWVDKNKRERVIFRPNHGNDPNFRIDNYKSINAIVIVELCKDYHAD